MGGVRSKALSYLAGVSAIERVVRAFRLSGVVEHVAIAVRPSDEGDFLALGFDTEFVTIIHGGGTRQESVSKGLAFLGARYPGECDLIVAVHDAARCLVSSDLIRRCIEAARECGAVTAAIPCHDSLTNASEGVLGEPIRREGVFLLQTPQVFRFDLLERAHREAAGPATDDTALVRPFHPVRIETGEKTNFKVTTQEDLELARAIASQNGSVGDASAE